MPQTFHYLLSFQVMSQGFLIPVLTKHCAPDHSITSIWESFWVYFVSTLAKACGNGCCFQVTIN